MPKLSRAHRQAISRGVSAYWRQVREVQRQTHLPTTLSRAVTKRLRETGIRSAHASRTKRSTVQSVARSVSKRASTPKLERQLASEGISGPDRPMYREFVSQTNIPPGEFASLNDYLEIRDYFSDYDDIYDFDDVEVEANADYEEKAG